MYNSNWLGKNRGQFHIIVGTLRNKAAARAKRINANRKNETETSHNGIIQHGKRHVLITHKIRATQALDCL